MLFIINNNLKYLNVILIKNSGVFIIFYACTHKKVLHLRKRYSAYIQRSHMYLIVPDDARHSAKLAIFIVAITKHYGSKKH